MIDLIDRAADCINGRGPFKRGHGWVGIMSELITQIKDARSEIDFLRGERDRLGSAYLESHPELRGHKATACEPDYMEGDEMYCGQCAQRKSPPVVDADESNCFGGHDCTGARDLR